MRVLNAVRRILLLLVLIPVVAVVLDIVLVEANANAKNPIVKGVHDFADVFILPIFKTVFTPPRQSALQNAAVTLVALGLLALLIVFIFRALRSMVGSRPPKAAAPAPVAKKPAPAAPATPAAKPVETSPTDPTADTTTDASTSRASSTDGGS